MSGISGLNSAPYQPYQLLDKHAKVIIPIERPEPVEGPFDQQAFEAVLSRLEKELTSYASRMALTSLIGSAATDGEANLATMTDAEFFDTHYPANTFWQRVIRLLARVIYAISHSAIGWRVGVGMQVVRDAVEQTANEGMVPLLRKATESLCKYVTTYNEASLTWAQRRKDGESVGELPEYVAKVREKELSELKQDLKNLCSDAEDIAIDIALPWGLRFIPRFFARQQKPLYHAIAALRDEKRQQELMHGIHLNLARMLAQVYDNLDKPPPKVDLSRRKLVLRFRSDPQKKLPSNIQELIPALITMLRNEQARGVSNGKLHDELLRRNLSRGLLDWLIGIKARLNDETFRNFITEEIFGQLAGADLYQLVTPLVHNIAFALGQETDADDVKARDQFEVMLCVLCDKVFHKYVRNNGEVTDPPKVSAVIDAGAEDCDALHTLGKNEVSKIRNDAKNINHALAKIPAERTSLKQINDYDSGQLDRMAWPCYGSALDAIEKIPSERRSPTVAKLASRLRKAVNAENRYVELLNLLKEMRNLNGKKDVDKALKERVDDLLGELRALSANQDEHYFAEDENVLAWTSQVKLLSEYTELCSEQLQQELPIDLGDEFIYPSPLPATVEAIVTGNDVDQMKALLKLIQAHKRDWGDAPEPFVENLKAAIRHAADVEGAPPAELFDPNTIHALQRVLFYYHSEMTNLKHVNRLLIRFNEVEIGRLAALCNRELSEQAIERGRQLRSTVGSLHNPNSPLGRAVHSVEWLSASNIIAFQKTELKSQEVFDRNLDVLAAAHRALEQKLMKIDHLEKLHQRNVKLEKKTANWIKMITGQYNAFEVENSIESIDGRIAALEENLATGEARIGELARLKEVRKLLLATRYLHLLKNLAREEVSASDLLENSIIPLTNQIKAREKQIAQGSNSWTRWLPSALEKVVKPDTAKLRTDQQAALEELGQLKDTMVKRQAKIDKLGDELNTKKKELGVGTPLPEDLSETLGDATGLQRDRLEGASRDVIDGFEPDEILPSLLNKNDMAWLEKSTADAIGLLQGKVPAIQKIKEERLRQIQMKLRAGIAKAIKAGIAPQFLGNYHEVVLVTRLERLKELAEQNTTPKPLLSTDLLEASLQADELQPLIRANQIIQAGDKNLEEVEAAVENAIEALRGTHEVHTTQLANRMTGTFKDISKTIDDTRWGKEGIIPKSQFWRMTGKSVLLAIAGEKTKKDYLDDLRKGFEKCLETPSHQEEIARVVLKLGAGVLKGIHA